MTEPNARERAREQTKREWLVEALNGLSDKKAHDLVCKRCGIRIHWSQEYSANGECKPATPPQPASSVPATPGTSEALALAEKAQWEMENEGFVLSSTALALAREVRRLSAELATITKKHMLAASGGQRKRAETAERELALYTSALRSIDEIRAELANRYCTVDEAVKKIEGVQRWLTEAQKSQST